MLYPDKRSTADGPSVYPELYFKSKGRRNLDSVFKFTIRTAIEQQPDGGLSVSGYQPLKLDKYYTGTQPGIFAGQRTEKILQDSGQTVLTVHIDVMSEMT